MSIDKIANELLNYATVDENIPMSSLTSLRIGGNARYVVYPTTVVALVEIMNVIKRYNLPFKVFGKGSNILCSDKNYDGVIIRLDRSFSEVYFTEDSCIAQAGCSIIAVAYEAMKNGLSGLEFASGIPAMVGGVTFMNAGAYNSNMAGVIEEVFVLHDGMLEWIPNSKCNFSYRYSVFHDNPDWIIIATKFRLKKKPVEEIKEIIETRKARRIAAQPLDKPSAGSTFKNPLEKPAWELIDGIGYRGKRIGGAMVSTKHVNFLINEDKATAKDFMDLVTEIQDKVKEKYKIDLYMEVERFNW
ncbi:MAG: UDP-N-acetylmuramate dehydrogenase [Erysipelotrichaceae bacterium]|nr:UDP-N-acetylmuramate dehydrogenase [Erysipelotrichaceae bacterium]